MVLKEKKDIIIISSNLYQDYEIEKNMISKLLELLLIFED